MRPQRTILSGTYGTQAGLTRITSFAILNPEYTFTLCGICDILAHLMERYFSSEQGNILSDGLLESAMRTIIYLGRRVIENPKDYNIRAQIMWTGTIAHNDLLDRGRNGGDWATGMIEHSVSAHYNIAHGAGLSILYPAWLLYVGVKKPEKILAFAKNVLKVEEQEKTTEIAVERLKNFYKLFGLSTSFSEAGISEKDFQIMSEEVAGTFPVGSYYSLKVEDVNNILYLAK